MSQEHRTSLDEGISAAKGPRTEPRRSAAEILTDAISEIENKARSLDARLHGETKGPKRPERTATKIVTETEMQRPPPPRGREEHRWPAPRGPPSPWGPPELWRLSKVLAVTGLKQSQILDAVSRGVFPRPLKILSDGRANAWVSTEIIDFIEGRIAARDKKPAKQATGKNAAVAIDASDTDADAEVL
jgi:predicted DNA-binding transcriptional regulator AlpA